MDPQLYPDYMAIALREAQLAFEKDEVPVGAVVVHDNRVIGRGHNLTASLHDATAHAEMIALTAAFNSIGDWRLEDCFLFSTLEPCIMCASAAVLSRINTIVYGAKDPKFGGCGSIITIPTIERLNHSCNLVGGVREEEVSELMRTFFQQVRKNKSRVN
jgi:tRNA(adenine34) deaminase